MLVSDIAMNCFENENEKEEEIKVVEDHCTKKK